MHFVSEPDQFPFAGRARLFIVGGNDPFLIAQRRSIAPSYSYPSTRVLLIKDLSEPCDRGQLAKTRRESVVGLHHLTAVPHPLQPGYAGPVVCSLAWESASSHSGGQSGRTSRGSDARAPTLGSPSPDRSGPLACSRPHFPGCPGLALRPIPLSSKSRCLPPADAASHVPGSRSESVRG